MQQFSADLTCHVVELADACEIILGEDWLCKYSATLSWGHKCCVLTKGSQRITLVPGPASDLDEPVQSVPGAYAAPLTAVQAGKAMANGCCAFLAGCTDAKPVADAACAAMPSDTAAGGTDQSQLMPESVLNALLHEYHDRFPEALPPGLPPERNIGHTISLEPGSKTKPPFRHAYRQALGSLLRLTLRLLISLRVVMLCLVPHRTLLLSCSFRRRMALCACALTIVL
ncbi:TPA: hypothetical protein ACH3X1_016713 [Trebouxia sp. C0004]